MKERAGGREWPGGWKKWMGKRKVKREEGKRKIRKGRDQGKERGKCEESWKRVRRGLARGGWERRGKKERNEEKENEMGKCEETRKGLTSSVDVISLLNMFCIKSSRMDS